jgi:hypothetical protein
MKPNGVARIEHMHLPHNQSSGAVSIVLLVDFLCIVIELAAMGDKESFISYQNTLKITGLMITCVLLVEFFIKKADWQDKIIRLELIDFAMVASCLIFQIIFFNSSLVSYSSFFLIFLRLCRIIVKIAKGESTGLNFKIVSVSILLFSILKILSIK